MNSFRDCRRPYFVEEETAPAGAVGYRLARQRRLAGLTQQQLAARSHVSVSLISQVERGVVPASSGFTAAVARGLGVEVEDLYAQPQGAWITDPRTGHAGVPALGAALDRADDPVLSKATMTPVELRTRLNECEHDQSRSRYAQMMVVLPELLRHAYVLAADAARELVAGGIPANPYRAGSQRTLTTT